MGDIGLHLKVMRSDIGMTQRELARLVGVSHQSVARWEGNRAAIPLEKFLAFCKATGADPVKAVETLTRGPAYSVARRNA